MGTTFSVLSLIAYGIIGAIVYRFIPDRYRAGYLSLLSITVYSIWTGWAVILLLAEAVIGWLVKIGLTERSLSKNKRRFVLISGISLIVLILLFNKYFYLFNLTNKFTDILAIIIPIGISYYSFKIISFIVDSYNGKNESIGLWEYISYICLFTQIASGPISKIDEIWNREEDSQNVDIAYSVQRIIRGLFYKLVIADRLSAYTLTVMGSYKSYNSLALFMAMIFYSIQLYADFAGYSDIVIGICGLYGMKIKENFNLPYFSKSIKEFWTRWHISLSGWLRDYIYIPLGGNRKGNGRKLINIMLVFLISGIWHGATGVYIIWGLWHGIWNILSPKKWKNKFFELISIIGTYIIVAIGWLCFSLNTVGDLLAYIRGLFINWSLSMNSIVEAVMPFSGDYSCVAKLITICLLILLTFILELRSWEGKKVNPFVRSLIYSALLILFGVFSSGNFIYANY